MKTGNRVFHRSRKANPPFGWTLKQCQNKKGESIVLWRCPYIQRNFFTKKFERCSYMCRKDRTNLKHNHVFGIIPELDDGLDIDCRIASIDNTNTNFINKMRNAVAMFIGSCSIPASMACSRECQRFLVNITETVREYLFSNPNVVFSPSGLIPKFNKNTMKDEIIRCGNHCYAKMIEEIRNYRFVKLMIDAATVHNLRIVHSTISNPFSLMLPVPFRSTKKEENDWIIEDYIEELETITSQIISLNDMQDLNNHIIITGICHDRLVTQSSAVRIFLSNLKISNPIQGLIVDVPCLNHLLNSSFVCAKNECNAFKEIVKQIEEKAVILRKRDGINFIGKKCPLPPETRWLYICDTLTFIDQNIEAVNSYLTGEWKKSNQKIYTTNNEIEMQANHDETIPRCFFELNLILAPFRHASLCFECEQSRLSDAIPIIQAMFEYYQELLMRKVLQEDVSYQILFEILAQWISRLIVYLPKETWACWSLTRPGRYYLRKISAPSGLPRGNICDYKNGELKENDAVVGMKHELQRMLNGTQEDTQNLLYEEEEINEELTLESLGCFHANADNEDTLTSLEYTNDENILHQVGNDEIVPNIKFKEVLDMNRTKNLEELLKFDIFENAYDKSIEVIRHYHNVLYPEESQNQINYLFDQWLYTDSSDPNSLFPSIDMERKDDFQVWQNMFKHDMLHPLSEIALRLVSVGTSESNVERLISAHRFIVHDRMTNIGTDTLISRLRMRAYSHSLDILENS